jgi:hypothetical protein
MSSPSHAACRASARTHEIVMRVSQLAFDGSSVRSLSCKLACADRQKPVTAILATTTGIASHVGDDLACFVAPKLLHYLR